MPDVGAILPVPRPSVCVVRGSVSDGRFSALVCFSSLLDPAVYWYGITTLDPKSCSKSWHVCKTTQELIWRYLAIVDSPHDCMECFGGPYKKDVFARRHAVSFPAVVSNSLSALSPSPFVIWSTCHVDERLGNY